MNNSDMPAMPIDFQHSKALEEGYVYTGTGLTKREHFAGLAMQGLIANSEWLAGAREEHSSATVSHVISRSAIAIADALLAELDKE